MFAGLTALVEGDEQLAQLGDFLIARTQRDQPSRHALERGPGLDPLAEFAVALAVDHGPLAGYGSDKTLAFEGRKRFPDRRSADAKFFGDLTLIDPTRLRRAVNVHFDERPFQGVVDLRSEVRLFDQAGERQLARRFAASFFGYYIAHLGWRPCPRGKQSPPCL